MKTKQYWDFMGSWPADGLSAERSTQVFRWNSHPYSIAASIRSDGVALYNVYEWVGGTEGKYILIEFGYSTLRRAKNFVDRYHAGLVPGIHQPTGPLTTSQYKYLQAKHE